MPDKFFDLLERIVATGTLERRLNGNEKVRGVTLF
jgi:hypothetical protein